MFTKFLDNTHKTFLLKKGPIWIPYKSLKKDGTRLISIDGDKKNVPKYIFSSPLCSRL